MKKFISLLAIVASTGSVFAQVSPYALTPEWYFGAGGRLSFPSGDFPTSGAPTPGFIPTTHDSWLDPEASTSVCHTDGSVAVYTNSSHAFNGSTVTTWTETIRNFTTDGTGAVSSSGGSVAFPDPASPGNSYYLVLANDMTSGGATTGVHQYRFTGTGTTVSYASGPTMLAPDTYPGEAITVGTDGAGGYWLVVHDKTATNTFRVWHYTAGGITGPTDYTPSANVGNTTNLQSYLKFSPCMDKIAYHSGNFVTVHQFDKTTGVVGAEIRRVTVSPYENAVGLEFSPDGQRIFHNGPGASFTGGVVNYVDIATGTGGSVAGSASWSIQLGPDGKIYTSPTGTRFAPASHLVGVISDPNGTPSYSTTALPGGGFIHRGLNNLAWLSPETPELDTTISCLTVDFTYVFQNYFLTDIDVASVRWDFGEGAGWETGLGDTPSHTYASSGSYTAQVEITDATCGQTWTGTIPVTLSDCVAPVELLSFTGHKSNNNAVLNWSTATEINNDYFIIERSFDGKNFVAVGTVDGHGTTTTTQHYGFTDYKPGTGVIYYRLKQVDYDGTTAYSNVVSITFDQGGIIITPNPFSGTTTVALPAGMEKHVIVYDVLGRTIQQTTVAADAEQVTIGQSLTPGLYIFSVTGEGISFTQKVVKE